MNCFTDPHTLKQRMKSVHYNFLPHKKHISCKKRIERQLTVREKYRTLRVTVCIVCYTNQFPYWGNILHGCGVFFFMSMWTTFLHVQLLIFYTLNTENEYIKKNLTIYNYKNISIAFGPEHPSFIHYNFLECTDSNFISLKRHMTFFYRFFQCYDSHNEFN